MEKQKQRRKINHHKLFLRLFILIILLTMGGIIYALTQIIGALAKGHDFHKKSDLRAEQVNINKDPFTVLFLGTDQRKDREDWRPDVIIVVGVNPKQKTAKVISIPRDSLVPIANTDLQDKINAAPYYGYKNKIDPIENTRKTLENFLGFPIDYYAKVNFQGFTDIVDALGGVDVNVKREFTQQMLGGDYAHFRLGKQHLDGKHALAYVRMRKKDPLGDRGRNERQREVMTQLMDKISSFHTIKNFDKLTSTIGENLTYSFQPSEFLALKEIYSNIPKQNIKTIKVNTEPVRTEIWYETYTTEERQRISNIFRDLLQLPRQQLKPIPEDKEWGTYSTQ
jgi:polyisoprenyl-teichoic acid--peptidoglycan teichoic acid transferase